jgi:hypothetical protein
MTMTKLHINLTQITENSAVQGELKAEKKIIFAFNNLGRLWIVGQKYILSKYSVRILSKTIIKLPFYVPFYWPLV